MGFGRRLRRAFRRIVGRSGGAIAGAVVGGLVGGPAGALIGGTLGNSLGGKEDKTQQMLIERQNQLLEGQKKKQQQMLEAAKLQEEENSKLAGQVTGEQTNLTEGQENKGNDFASSGTSDIDTDWLDGVIDEDVREGVDKNIVI